ncbi:MAG: ribonuclease HII [Gemmatimonadaceae bacterium]
MGEDERVADDAPRPAGGAARSPARRHRWTTIERDLRRAGGALIAGVDEVGRGSLAGPVVACATIMPPDVRAIAGVDDSKQLTARQRERLAVRILERALDVRIAAASAREIDRLNIYHASVLAMRRALAGLKLAPHHVLVDGRQIRTLGIAHTGVVHGDARCFNIACASIVAKVTRDRLMARLATRYPSFRWEKNCGYTTAAHVVAIVEHGVTPHHRRSFIVKALTADLTQATGVHDPLDLDEVADVIASSGAGAPPSDCASIDVLQLDIDLLRATVSSARDELY